ncbi:hypothetical protein KFK09_008412 [Dendrobium nobile]|uniref:Uncharacterized protein n=1 Tax=Dendrobium nobile TaxID=94219 RepID=A0A8T3BN20_DENNO|nr:hypothetical protein KFK09_008412 [Dendrobium nobile]
MPKPLPHSRSIGSVRPVEELPPPCSCLPWVCTSKRSQSPSLSRVEAEAPPSDAVQP